MDHETQLRAAARNWRDSQKQIGEIINAGVAAGKPETVFIGIMRGFGMPEVTVRCCMKWAAGVFGDDDTAADLMSRVAHSTLKFWTADTAASATTAAHRIVSPDEGRVVSKPFAKMSRREVARNTNNQGFIPIEKQTRHEPEFRSCNATRVEWNDDGTATVVSQGRGETIRMKVSRKLLNELMAAREVAA